MGCLNDFVSNGYHSFGKRDIIRNALCLSGVLLLLAGLLFQNVKLHAETKDGGRGRLRVGYCQGGGYYEFDYEIYQIGAALSETGLLHSNDLEELSEGAGAKDVWKALSGAESEAYEFVEDGFFDLAAGELATLEGEAQRNALGRMIGERRIDLMITMGTNAGLAVKGACDVPYMNFIANDPVGSGIVEAAKTSGSERGWAHVNEGLDLKAISVMDEVFTPGRIGITYSATDPEAYIYSGAKNLDAYAKAHGKSVVREYVTDVADETEEAYRLYFDNLCKAHQRLVDEGVDVYVMTTSSLRAEDFEEALRPFVEGGIPVFSINSTEDVRFGALAAVEMFDYRNIGRFAADTMEKYRQGASLAQLPQEYATSPFLVVNADTLRRTGLRLPFDALVSASEIYGKYGEE